MAGATGASLFALKYSGIFVAFGAGVVFGIDLPKASLLADNSSRRREFSCGCRSLILAVPQGPTPCQYFYTPADDILRAMASFGLPAIGVTDLDPLLGAVLANTSLTWELIAPFIGDGVEFGHARRFRCICQVQLSAR